MPTAISRPRPHARWRLAALAYTAAGVACVLGSVFAPESDAAMLLAIVGGLPWSLSLATLDLEPGVAYTALLLLGVSWALNAALLWWLALRRPTHRMPSRST